MAKDIRGKDILDALAEFREPVTLKTIVKYISDEYSRPVEQVKKLVEDTLNGGVRYGYVQKHNQFYYRVCDAVDAIGAVDGLDDVESSEEDDEMDSVDSNESIVSDGHDEIADTKPPNQQKKNAEPPKKAAPNQVARKPSRVRRLTKREREKRDRELARMLDQQDDEDEEEDEIEYALFDDDDDVGRPQRTRSDMNGMKRRRNAPSVAERGKARGRSRSVQRR